MQRALEKIELKDARNKVDFGIITVREDEQAAVWQRFNPRWFCVGQSRYQLAEFRSRSGRWLRAALARSFEQGNGSAQTVATHLIADLAPEYLVLVGIAGAVPEFEFTLGDVVVATRLHDFSVTAALAEERRIVDQGAPAHRRVLAATSALQHEVFDWDTPDNIGAPRPGVSLAAENLTGDPAWNKKLRATLESHFGAGNARDRPRATAVPIADGNTLMKSPALIRRWLAQSHDLKAVEMELSGVFRAAGGEPVVGIRGISDIVGFKRDRLWTAYACHSAASFAKAFLSAELLELKRTRRKPWTGGAADPMNAPGANSRKPEKALPMRSPALAISRFDVRQEPWPEDLTTRLVLDRTSLIGLVEGIAARELLASCTRAEALITKLSDRRFGERRWRLWNAVDAMPDAEGIIWQIDASTSADQIANAMQLLSSMPPAAGCGRVLGLVLADGHESDLEDYLRRLSELAMATFPGAPVMGWSMTKFKRPISLSGQHSERNLELLDKAEMELVRLLEASQSLKSSNARQDLEARAKRSPADIRSLCMWAAGHQTEKEFEGFLATATANSCRFADFAGLLSGRSDPPGQRDAGRIRAIVRAAEGNDEIKTALVSLPACEATVQALLHASVGVRVCVGLVSDDELSRVPQPWSGNPVELWRRRRPICLAR